MCERESSAAPSMLRHSCKCPMQSLHSGHCVCVCVCVGGRGSSDSGQPELSDTEGRCRCHSQKHLSATVGTVWEPGWMGCTVSLVCCEDNSPAMPPVPWCHEGKEGTERKKRPPRVSGGGGACQGSEGSHNHHQCRHQHQHPSKRLARRSGGRGVEGKDGGGGDLRGGSN